MAIAKKEYEFSSWEKVYEDWFKKEIGPLFDKYLEKVRKEYQDKKMLYKEEDIYYEAYQRTYKYVISNKSLGVESSSYIGSWRNLAIDELGIEKYKSLSQQYGEDLASYYGSLRFADLLKIHLAKKNIPKGTLEYMWKRFQSNESDFCVKTVGRPKEQKEFFDEIKNKSLELKFGSNPPTSVKIADSFISNLNPNKFNFGKSFNGMFLMFGCNVYDSFTGDNPIESLSKSMYGDKEALSRQQTRKVTTENNPTIVEIEKNLKKDKNKVAGKKFSQSNVDEHTKDLYQLCTTESFNNFGGEIHSRMKGFFEGIHIDSNLVTPPQWMANLDDKEIRKNACCYLSILFEMKDTSTEVVKVGKKYLKLNEVAQRTKEYVSECLRRDMINKANEVKYEDIMNDENVETQQRSEQLFQQAQCSQSINGWNDFSKGAGLEGFGKVFDNLGYVLAMLPDMLMAMFRGETNLKVKDNLFPMASIIAGLFVKSPLLKAMLIGFGGAKIVNNCGQEILDNKEGNSPKNNVRYEVYEDEELDMRIGNPEVKGNTLIADIDGEPNVVPVDERTMDAYYQGAIPLNTLCNAVLRKYDEQKSEVSEQYEQNINKNQEIQQGRLLR